jgi:hypothetical protein
MKMTKIFAFAFSLIIALQADRSANAANAAQTFPYLSVSDMRVTSAPNQPLSLTFTAEFGLDPAHASFTRLGVIIVAGPQGVLTTGPNDITNISGFFAGQNPTPDGNGNVVYFAKPATGSLPFKLNPSGYYYAYFFLCDSNSGGAIPSNAIQYTFRYNQISPDLASGIAPTYGEPKLSVPQGFPFYIPEFSTDVITIDPANPPAQAPALGYQSGQQYANQASTYYGNDGTVFGVNFNPVINGNVGYGTLGYIVFENTSIGLVQRWFGYTSGVAGAAEFAQNPFATNVRYSVVKLPPLGQASYTIYFFLVDANGNAVAGGPIGFGSLRRF